MTDELLSTTTDPDWLLLEDGPLLAVNKPVGWLTEGPLIGPRSLVNEIKAWLAKKYGKEGNVYLGVPHRLDRATSGVLVFGKNSKVSKRLSEQFSERTVTKKYLAILAQPPEPAEGLLVDWLTKNREAARSDIATPETDGAREARLDYRTLGPVEGGTLVEVTLITGRMHQIRVQFASRGWTVLGDTKYGGSEWARPEEFQLPVERIALHARTLKVKHPIRYDEMLFEAPLPEHWPELPM
ncbi:MAG: RNA pseudouridine synthase [Planctomycetota bacterium]|nr:RNA pseudouridine synthase [Planctomycetota bacterium]MDA1248532.1 RNA pseudouridine synthase [Planctomycetota bacterium]